MRTMKDYANPLLLLAVIVLMACRASADAGSAADQLDIWILSLCATGMLVDAALALAKALAHRPSVMNVVWAAVFLVLGSCAWALRATPLSEDQSAYQQQNSAGQDPLARDAEGETLLSRAAALGKEDVVRKILNETHPSDELIAEAGLRAAENNKPAVLAALASLGLSSNAVVRGVPLLHAAAQNGACDAMEWLLLRGAQVNSRDAEGATPLIQAAASENLPAVRMLLNHGADKRLRDSSGKCAADFARNEEMETLLELPPTPAIP